MALEMYRPWVKEGDIKTDFKFIVINNTQWSVFAILGRAFQPCLEWRVDSRKRGEEDFLKERILKP